MNEETKRPPSNSESGIEVVSKRSFALVFIIAGLGFSPWLSFVGRIFRGVDCCKAADSLYSRSCIRVGLQSIAALVTGFLLIALTRKMWRMGLCHITHGASEGMPDRWLEERRATTGAEPKVFKLWSHDRDQQIPLGGITNAGTTVRDLSCMIWTANSLGIAWASYDSTDQVYRLRAGIGTKASSYEVAE